MTTIEIPRDLLAAVHRAAAADGTSVPSMVEQALRTLIRDRVIQQEAARDPLDPPTTRSFGRMQDVYDSYLMEGLGAPRGGH
ncbi:ribbon-helix-helix protein, CopG family [Nakamurella sp.]|uniref:ribbon-helix-helix protein, CopG family n=1 Tax=Nakamurella sp. TaxID=1869182 RepID=UPI003782F929